MITGSSVYFRKDKYHDYEVAAIQKRCDHVLKIEPKYFELQISGLKPYEIRFDDRGFKVGDVIMLKEIEMKHLTYTGRFCVVRVTHIFSDFLGLKEGYCVMSTTLKFHGRLR